MNTISFSKIKHKCFVKSGIYVRGSAFLNKRLLNEEIIANELMQFKTPDEIVLYVKLLNGCFSITVDNDDFTLVIQDRFKTYHLSYSVYKDKLYVSDDTYFIVEKTNQQTINENNYKELIYAGYSGFNETIVKNIYQVMPGEYVLFNKLTKKLIRDRYYLFSYKKEHMISADKSLEKLDLVTMNVGKRLVKQLNNRQCVVLLSGGVDSRYCALLLKKMNYKNTILVTYGSRLTEEYKPAVAIAKKLGYLHYFIPYKRSEWRKTYKDIESLNYIQYSSNLSNISHLREHFVINELLKRNIVTKESVIVPGHLGNVAGRSYYRNDMKPKDLVIPLYEARMFHYNHKDLKSKHMKFLRDRVSTIVNHILSLTDIYEVCQVAERYSLDSYTVVYLVNSIRAYDFYSLNWMLPLLDHELVDFFQKVPIEKKCSKKLLYEYVDNQLGKIPYSNAGKSFFKKLIRNILDKRYSLLSFPKSLFLHCEANSHIPFYKRVYRYYRNFSSYCAVIEIQLMKNQLNK
ncbi:MAG: 7-cyano-7-deazaguanine synthase [Clostridiales bacterium]|nr:7-cyano-7-deazaguanine synthase [Clostridiales bacterium]